MKRSYDVIAGKYDWLAKFFIGKVLQNSQIFLIRFIPAGANILIVGGGTGWILEEITKLHHEGLKIDYLDISAKMIAQAKKRTVQHNLVRFLNQSVENDFEGNEYDVIFTTFLFDNFREATMQSIFNKLHLKLKTGGLWLYADFQVAGRHRFFQRTMLFMMYTFFRVLCNIEASHLPDVASQFTKLGYLLIDGKTFKQKFIISAVYKKV